MVNVDRARVGKWGEELAEHFLANKGYLIITKNFRTRFGEIDIVCRDGNTLVFVEVKTRSNEKFGTPEESVTRDKQDKLRLAAEYFLLIKKLRSAPWRIDTIGIKIDEDGRKAKINHIKNAVGEK